MLAITINIGLYTTFFKVGLEFEVCLTVERPEERERFLKANEIKKQKTKKQTTQIKSSLHQESFRRSTNIG